MTCFFDCNLWLSQDYAVVKGKVVDVYSGDPLPNANVVLVGTQQGAATDLNGEFIINRVSVGEYQLNLIDADKIDHVEIVKGPGSALYGNDAMGGMSDNEAKVENINSSIVWNRGFLDRFNVLFTGYYTDNFRTYQSAHQGSPQPASIDTTTDELFGIESDFTFIPAKKVKVDFGLDFSSNDYENERLPAVQNRKQTGVFTQIETNSTASEIF